MTQLLLDDKHPYHPFWTDNLIPEFINRTDTEYAHVPLSTLQDRKLDNRLLESLLEYLPDGVIIAGGFMTSIMQGEKNAGDIDMFFTGPEALRDTMELLKNPPDDDEAWAWQEYSCASKTDTLQALRYVKYTHEKRIPIQLVKLVWYEDAQHVIDTFDFTVTQFACDKNGLYMNALSPLDLARKHLVLHRLQFAASSLRRMIKYTKKGFYACPGALANIANQIRDNTNSIAGGEEDFVYID